jgi:hypothetical protein
MPQTSLDDFDNPVGARVDQDRAVVHDRVSVIPNAIFLWHVVICYAFLRQDCAYPDVLAISIGRAMLFDHITAKARTLIDAENPGYAANDAADDGTDGAGSSFAFS